MIGPAPSGDKHEMFNESTGWSRQWETATRAAWRHPATLVQAPGTAVMVTFKEGDAFQGMVARWVHPRQMREKRRHFAGS